MGGYLSTTQAQRREMLAAVGAVGLLDLYEDAPAQLILQDNGLDLPQGQGELGVDKAMRALAAKNRIFPTVLRGAGAYRHYIPAIVQAVAAKETFVTAYTPYQAEISQGVLQAIFEYQTMICQLTGMDVSNASVYDGPTAAAEAVAMCRTGKRTKALVSEAVHPDVLEVVRTYCWAAGAEMVPVPMKDGATDLAALATLVDEQTACVYLQQPNYLGLVEDCDKAGEIAHAAGAKYIMGVNPIAAALLKTPRECGADIAVGEGQPLGMPLSFGGPYLGFMAATTALMRKLPGRIAGQTTDAEGRRAYVLTLQAREQHIRREKASSNICSNQALCALTAGVYMAAMGPEGMRETARQCAAKAHYLAQRLCEIPGVALAYEGAFFHEFVTSLPVAAERVCEALEAQGILGGLPVAGGLLWCATELNTMAELDKAAQIVGEVCGI